MKICQKTFMHAIFLCFILVLAGQLTSCGNTNNEGSHAATNLGQEGNTRVASTFNAFTAENNSCFAAGPGKRVIVTGFGLFVGVSYNISGSVVSSFADSHFAPDNIDPTTKFKPRGTPANGILTDEDKGARVVNRSMIIGDERYEICFLTLDTLWDLAAAIIVDEANHFKPDMILMTGRGVSTADLEGGAYNDATPQPGYNSDGSVADEVTPVEPSTATAKNIPIIPGSPRKLMMTWHQSQLYSRVRSMVTALGFAATIHPDALRDNNYICNNVSYVVLAAAHHEPINLADGKIKLVSQLNTSTHIGFFHFPDKATNETAAVGAWINILAAMIDTELHDAPPQPGT